MTRIVCQQLHPRVGDPPANRERSLRAIAAAAGEGADIVVLPELVTSGYVFESVAEARAAAVSPDDSLFSEWATAAGGAVVIAGFAELGPDGMLYNSAAVLDRSGLLGVYRKAHLWDSEKLFFTPGGAPPRVFETPAGRIGVLVCYDIEFPEMTRLLALAGAELIAVPTNWPLGPRPVGERPPEVTIAMAAARVNRVFVACCDRTGTERGQAWTAGTTIVDERGWVLAAQTGEGSAAADIDLARAHDKTMAQRADAFGDRRPELYAALARP